VSRFPYSTAANMPSAHFGQTRVDVQLAALFGGQFWRFLGGPRIFPGIERPPFAKLETTRPFAARII